MKLLVTGGAGYIGSHVVHHLVGNGDEVVVIDNLVNGHRWATVDSNVELVVGDIGDGALVQGLFERHSFEAVMHFAAYAYVGESVADPISYYQNNVAAPLALLSAMERAGCNRLVLSSTCATYGEPDALPITELTPQRPVNPYGRSKWMLEQILDDCETAWGLRSACLRYFNACGASRDGKLGESHTPETHLIPLVLMAAAGEIECISVFGTDYETPDGTCIRDYVHVEDLATAHAAALDYLVLQNSSLRCNVGTGRGVSVKEIIDIAGRVTGKSIPVVYGSRRPGDPARLVADVQFAKELLGWKAAYPDVQDAIRSAWSWMTSSSPTAVCCSRD